MSAPSHGSWSGVLVAGLLLAAAAPLPAQRLFRATDPVPVTFTTDLRALLRERDSTRVVPHPAVMTYRDVDGRTRSMPVTLRARGHFRRQARNCDFPPLRVEFRKRDAEGTLFQGNTQLKLTTACRPRSAEYQQYVLAEYALYRAYALVSPVHFRTRLVQATYRDSAGRADSVTSWAFFLEDDREVAKEHDVAVEGRTGARFDDLDPDQLAITALFEYLIGNTDWSIGGLHNIALLRDSAVTIRPVAYDFDWSGAVNPRYAFPDAKLPIRKVTERLYRGPCLTEAAWQPYVARFQKARPAIDSLYGTIPGLDADRVASTRRYFDDFWRTLETPRLFRREIIATCLPQGN